MSVSVPVIADDPSTWVCKYCSHQGIRIEERLETVPWGNYSLAGVQNKYAARKWLWAVCEGCGHESRGQKD